MYVPTGVGSNPTLAEIMFFGKISWKTPIVPLIHTHTEKCLPGLLIIDMKMAALIKKLKKILKI